MPESQSEVDKTVFVSNLHSSVKEEILYELFLQAGPVRKVIIPRDRDGRKRSFGFVHYKHAEAVPYAIELLNGIWLCGRPITLRYTYGNSHQTCAAASPTLQNGLAGNSWLPPKDEPSWSDMMSRLPVDHFSAVVPTTQGQLWPAVSSSLFVIPQWPWLNSGFAPWIPTSDPQSPTCTMSKTDAEHSQESAEHRKRQRSHERKRRCKRTHKT